MNDDYTRGFKAAAAIALPELKRTLNEIGGCDHDAGICCCDLLHKIDLLETPFRENHPDILSDGWWAEEIEGKFLIGTMEKYR